MIVENIISVLHSKMIFYTKAYFRYFLFGVVLTEITDVSESDQSPQRFDDIFDFAIGLKDESDNILNYASWIQALFCPNQPVCTADGTKTSSDVLATLPKNVQIGTELYQIKDVHNIVGACCLSCSCDTRSCNEDANCCLSKIFLDALEDNPDLDDHNSKDNFGHLNSVFENKNATAVNSKCVKASWLSYRDEDAIEIEADLDIPGYSMITRCFEANTKELDQAKCQNPAEFEDAFEMLPVTSLDTGRIYWSTHCAQCNNDEKNILPWNASVEFNTGIAYFVNTTDKSYDNVYEYPDNFSGISQFISKAGGIFYTPPFAQNDKLCLQRYGLYTCNRLNGNWLEKACDSIYSPFMIEAFRQRRLPYQNIFCYFCRHVYIKPNANRTCGYVKDNFKYKLEGISALLDFTTTRGDDSALITSTIRDKCACEEIYDPRLHYCRRIYCPTGDFMVNCKCIQPLKIVYGMPILLTIKLIPRSNNVETIKTNQISNFHNVLKKKLKEISSNISVEFIGMFECKSDSRDYYLSVMIIRSSPGNDTKVVIRPFLEYLDSTRKQEKIVFKQTTYSVRLTSRIRLWTVYNSTKTIFNMRDLESTLQNRTWLFSTDDMRVMWLFSTEKLQKAYYQRYQVLSPLLYCRQVQLNDTEFEDTEDRLITHTARKITLWYYRYTSPSTARVCADQYINDSARNLGTKLGHTKLCLFLLLTIVCGTYLNQN